MSRKRNKNKKTSYKSFDYWKDLAKKSWDELKEDEEAKEDLEKEIKKILNKTSQNNKSSKNKKFKSNGSIYDKSSHEGKVNSKGSIKEKPIMGNEGDPVNPDLRRRLEEKRRAEIQRARNRNFQYRMDFSEASPKNIEKAAKIAELRSSIKNKEDFKKAILLSEILSPPLSKRKNY